VSRFSFPTPGGPRNRLRHISSGVLTRGGAKLARRADWQRSVVAPLQRPVLRRPAIQNRESQHRFSISSIHIAQQCDSFATYRRLSCLSASTICRCKPAHRLGGRRTRLNPGHIAGRISWSAKVFTDSGA